MKCVAFWASVNSGGQGAEWFCVGHSSTAPLASVVLDEDFDFGSAKGEQINMWNGVLFYFKTCFVFVQVGHMEAVLASAAQKHSFPALLSRESHKGNSSLAALAWSVLFALGQRTICQQKLFHIKIIFLSEFLSGGPFLSTSFPAPGCRLPSYAPLAALGQ